MQLFIGAAGLAAHLPGVLASLTAKPVIGIPLDGGSLGGADALYAVVQMPPGVPVATVAIGARRARRTRRTSPRASWRSRDAALAERVRGRPGRAGGEASCASTRGPDVIDRYALPELREIFGERRKLELWLRIELLAVEALHDGRGGARRRTGSASAAAAGEVDPERAREIERSRSTTSSPSCARSPSGSARRAAGCTTG